MPSDNLILSIPKQEIATLPVSVFRGQIHVIDTPEKAAQAVSVLMQQSLIGFDTETKPSFKKGKSNKVALMQLSTNDQCFLLRLNQTGMTDELKVLIENPDVKKVGISVHDDFNVMHRSSDFKPDGFIELQSFVKNFYIADISLQKIYAIIFGEKISKSQRLTNWEAPTLTPQQQLYAATDAWACLRIYQHLIAGKFDPTTSPYILPEAPAPDIQ